MRQCWWAWTPQRKFKRSSEAGVVGPCEGLSWERAGGIGVTPRFCLVQEDSGQGEAHVYGLKNQEFYSGDPAFGT